MALSDNEKATLDALFDRCHDNWDALNDWEKKFIEDQEKRYEEYGAEIRLSPKQWDILNKVEDVLTNGRSKR